MKKCALFFLLATWATFAFAGVAVYSPTGGSTASSPVHFAASGSSPNCSKGIGGMGIFTAPYKLAYKVSGSKIDTHLSLSNGTYNTVVQQWDNCGWTATKEVTTTVRRDAKPHTVKSTNKKTVSPQHNPHLKQVPYHNCTTCITGDLEI